MSTPTIRVINPRECSLKNVVEGAVVVLDTCVFGDVGIDELVERQKKSPLVLDLLIRNELLTNEKILRQGTSMKSDTRRIMLDCAKKVLPLAHIVNVASHPRYPLERTIMDPLSRALPKFQAVDRNQNVFDEWYSSLAYLVDWRECTYGYVGINDIRLSRGFASQFMFELLEDSSRNPPREVRECRSSLLGDRADGTDEYRASLSEFPNLPDSFAIELSSTVKNRLVGEYRGAVHNVWQRLACASLTGEQENTVASRLISDVRKIRPDQHMIMASYLFTYNDRPIVVYSADKDVYALASLRMQVCPKNGSSLV